MYMIRMLYVCFLNIFVFLSVFFDNLKHIFFFYEKSYIFVAP
ncbi:hypothetical protein HMPREF0663_11790 [Hoylesella oralis ATCC 33269]|uniref:Uncharacterized protein n=1 Tax=Hoylesella oralis ATCC 33269 TaxID=873533 RepID=E7RRI9_9BACT|nr:hypothetical protein HMPREF0663_11790 [Hoylesella oralis ATCC 33269]